MIKIGNLYMINGTIAPLWLYKSLSDNTGLAGADSIIKPREPFMVLDTFLNDRNSTGAITLKVLYIDKPGYVRIWSDLFDLMEYDHGYIVC